MSMTEIVSFTFLVAPEDILRLTVREIPKPESFHKDFNEFRFFPRLIGTGDIYVEAALSMFQELGLIERFRIRRRTLARFLLMVQKGYREVSFEGLAALTLPFLGTLSQLESCFCRCSLLLSASSTRQGTARVG